METNTTKIAHCNICGGERNHKIRDSFQKHYSEEDDHYVVTSTHEYFFLQCLGCDHAKILHETWCSEWADQCGLNKKETYYPPSIFRRQPDWLWKLNHNWHITKMLKEVYRAIQNDAFSLAAMGIRSIIELVMIDKVGDKNSFSKNLLSFMEKGYISKVQKKSLDGALELGHASIHRGHIPTEDQLMLALDIMENIVHGLYVLEDSANSMFNSLPKRKRDT